WQEAGYFDETAHLKPLLHTWSLSVEEQFYLVWPLAFALASRWFPRWAPALLLAAGGAASFALAEIFRDRTDAIFYLAPFRGFEFAIGALLVWIRPGPRMPRLALEGLAAAGIIAIAYSVVAFTDDTPFPGRYALIPCLGAALVIYAGRGSLVGRALSLRPVVWVGLISYSLYLIHWPILVFTEYVKLQPLTAVDQWAICIASVAAAALMHRFVEQPFRRPSKARPKLPAPRFALACVGAALLLAAPAALAWRDDGWTWRVPPDKRALIASTEDGDAPASHPCQYWTHRARGESFQERFDNCTANEGPAVVILGDSHGIDTFHALAANAEHRHIVGLTTWRCRLHSPENCREYTDFRNAFIAKNAGDISFILYNQKGSYFLKTDYVRPPLDDSWVDIVIELLRDYEELGVPIAWIGPRAELLHDPTAAVLPMRSIDGADDSAVWNHHMIAVDALIKRHSRKADLDYISVMDHLSPDGRGELVVDRRFTYHDTDHWSATGERLFGARLLAQNAFLADIFRPGRGGGE
ncbi:MAG: acyltransferase, partial [Caulobacterales bacterium]|nr:acyltransferase [Caulobacterales bacterium]